MDRYDGLLRKAYPHLPTDVPPCRFRPRPEAEAIAVELLRSRQVDSGFVVLALGGNEWNKRMESGPWIDLIHRLEADSLPAILMGHARGVICLAATQAGIPVVHYASTQVKRILTGAGRADKLQMQRAIQRELHLPQLPEPPDVADALAIALCHYYLKDKPGKKKLTD